MSGHENFYYWASCRVWDLFPLISVTRHTSESTSFIMTLLTMNTNPKKWSGGAKIRHGRHGRGVLYNTKRGGALGPSRWARWPRLRAPPPGPVWTHRRRPRPCWSGCWPPWEAPPLSIWSHRWRLGLARKIWSCLPLPLMAVSYWKISSLWPKPGSNRIEETEPSDGGRVEYAFPLWGTLD